MRSAMAVAAVVALWGCASPGTAEDFTWSSECPKTVDKGAEFLLTVNATKPSGPSPEGETGPKAVEGVPFHWQIHWAEGSTAPLRHLGHTGEAIKIRARLAAGPATLLITSLNKDGLDVKVLETKFEVK